MKQIKRIIAILLLVAIAALVGYLAYTGSRLSVETVALSGRIAYEIQSISRNNEHCSDGCVCRFGFLRFRYVVPKICRERKGSLEQRPDILLRDIRDKLQRGSYGPEPFRRVFLERTSACRF